jgi:hypothetical protein
MVISRQYKFVFVELPLTATTAISKELREMYDGEPFLHKHATYRRFLKTASPEIRTYTPVSNIRVPLDQAVSMYFKYKNDKELGDLMLTGKNKKQNGTSLRLYLSIRRHKTRAGYVLNNNATFEQYFFKFYKLPYSDWSVLDHKKFEHLIRFEHLAEDYKKVFTEIGVPVRRDLPAANKTPGREKTFWSYYATDRAKRHAKFIFGPYMRYWGYEFPKDWNNIREPWHAELLFNLLNIPRKFYWKYLM